MATVRTFVVMSDKFQLIGIKLGANYPPKWSDTV